VDRPLDRDLLSEKFCPMPIVLYLKLAIKCTQREILDTKADISFCVQ